MPIVAGIDSSPSTTRVVVCDALSGRILRRAAVSHSVADDPHEWWNALVAACSDGILDGVQAVFVAGQRQALVTVDATGAIVRPAMMASDQRAATSADDLVIEGGGIAAWAAAVGSVPAGSSPIAKLRWLARREPDNAARVAAVMQPHDWLTWLLIDGATAPVTDRGDASGTGYWSPTSGEYRMTLLGHAFGREVAVPHVLGPTEAAGHTGAGVLVAPGTGAAMAAVLGLEAGPGDVVISIGSTGTLFAGGLERPVVDATGTVSGFADATGRHLAMLRTGEAMPSLDAAASLLGVDVDGLSRLALESTPGAQGLVMLPPRGGSPGSLTGLRYARMTAANLARAAVEGLLCAIAEGLDALAEQLALVGTPVRRVILTGRGARIDAVRLIAPAILGVPVSVALGGVIPSPAGGESPEAAYAANDVMAIGAARQAAWVLAASSAPSGEVPAAPPSWTEAVAFRESPVAKAGIGEGVRAQYAGARESAEAAAAALVGLAPTFEAAGLTASGVMTFPPGTFDTGRGGPTTNAATTPEMLIPHQGTAYGAAPPSTSGVPYGVPAGMPVGTPDYDLDDEDYTGRRRR